MVLEVSSASRQRPRQRCATVDHSDIRGSSASTRHHGRDPSGAALRLKTRVRPAGYRIELVEGSPLPRATTAAVCLRFAPYGSWDLPVFSGGLSQRDVYFPLHVHADSPDEAEQLTPHGRDRLLFALAPSHQPRVSLMQALLRFPGECGHRRAAAPLPGCERFAHRGAMPVGPGRLYHDAPQMGIARLADGPAADARTARVLARDDSTVTHQLARMLEARELPELGHDRDCAELCDPAQALQCLDHRT